MENDVDGLKDYLQESKVLSISSSLTYVDIERGQNEHQQMLQLYCQLGDPRIILEQHNYTLIVWFN